MLSLTTRQQQLIDGEYKIANWLVIVTDKNSNRYYWSTRNVPNTEEHGDFIQWDDGIEWDTGINWDNGGDNIDASNAFNFKIIDWPGITLRRGGAESGILAPNDLDFTITNKNSALTADDFIGGTVWVHLSIGDNDGSEIFHRWRFKVKKATPTHQKIKFICQDFIQEYLRTDYPNEKLVDNIFPSNDQKAKDNLCAPIPFGVAYVPLRSVYITDQRYYLLGPASFTYTISAVHSPSEMPSSEWTSPDYAFTQSTKADGDAVDWRVFQPIIADSNNDGTADASGLFRSGDVFLDVPTKFSRSDTVNITNPAYVLKFVLEDLGIATDDLNIPSFATAAITFASRGLSFNGAIFYQRPAKDIIAELLSMCNSILIEQIKFKMSNLKLAFSINQHGVLKPQDVSEAIFHYTDVSDETDYDSAYAAFQEANKPQDKLIKIPVPVKSSYDNFSGEIFEMPFIQDSENVQKATSLILQRKYLKKANIDFTSKGNLLALLPDDVITIDDSNYGGTYLVLLEEIHINKDLQLFFSCIRFKETLDDWEDLSFSDVTIAADDSTDYWTPVIAGPDSPLTGNEIPNQLRGRLRIGQTGNYILLDPAEPIIKLDEGGTDRVLIGDLGGSNFGIQINNAAGNMVMKIDGSSAIIGGWNITTTTLSKNNALLDSAGKLELGTSNDIIILSAIDATYRLAIGHATYASAPFRVTKEGALTATSATITGTITATAGVIGGFTVDATEGLYAGSGATRVQMKAGAGIWTGATAIGGAPFSVTNAGVLKAVSGIIGGWTLAATTLSSANITLDQANDKITVNTITIDGANDRIRSSNYVSGVMGAGFTLEPDLLEVGNIASRGIIRTAVFQKDVISCIGGSLFVRPADVLATDMTALDASTLTIEGNETFAVGDILRIKDGTNDEWLLVTNIASAPTYTVTRDQAAGYAADSNPVWKKGASIISYGASGKGGIYMTSSEVNAPYLSVFTHAGAPWTTIVEKARMGNLNGYLGYSSDIYGFAAGTGNEFIKLDPTNGLQISSAKTDALTIKDGGNIKLEAGGDLILIGADANAAKLIWDGTEGDLEVYCDVLGSILYFLPTVNNSMSIKFGDFTKKFSDIANVALGYLDYRSYVDEDNQAAVYIEHNGSNASVRFILIDDMLEKGVRFKYGGGVQAFYPGQNNEWDLGLTGNRWKHGWFSDNLVVEGVIEADTTVVDDTNVAAIRISEGDNQARGRNSLEFYNKDHDYIKARLWTQVGSAYGSPLFGIDVADASSYTDKDVFTRLVIDKDGNVGIGATDPDELLELYKVGTQLKLSGGAADYATFAVAADGALTITTNDTDAAEADIILMPDGNVGIGTTSPSDPLTVEGIIPVTIRRDIATEGGATGLKFALKDDGDNWHTYSQIYGTIESNEDGNEGGQLKFYTSRIADGILVLGAVIDEDQNFDVTGCVTDGTCEIYTEDALSIIKEIMSTGSGQFDKYNHERFDMAKLHIKYPFLFPKRIRTNLEIDKKEIVYGDKLGAKSDLLYRAVMQLSEENQQLNKEIQLLKAA